MKTFLMSPYIELTTACNLKCLHCYNDSGEQKVRLEMNDFEKLYESLAKADVDTITFSGGEPMLHPDFTKLVDYFSERGFAITVVSNATLVTGKLIDKLKGKNLSFQFSLNGSKASTHDSLCGKGSFEKTVNGLDKIIKNFENTTIHSMIVTYNVHDILGIIDFVYKKGIKNISFASVNNLGRAADDMDNFGLTEEEMIHLSNQLETNEVVLSYREKGMRISFPTYSNGCPFLSEDNQEIGIAPRIDSYGYVYLCQSFNNYSFGNIHEKSLYNLIYNDQSLTDLLQLIQDARNGIAKCKKCVWQYICGRGCPADVVMTKGDIYALDNYCKYRQNTFLAKLKESI